MAYTRHTWVCGEQITESLMNNLEEGVEEALDGGCDETVEFSIREADSQSDRFTNRTAYTIAPNTTVTVAVSNPTTPIDGGSQWISDIETNHDELVLVGFEQSTATEWHIKLRNVSSASVSIAVGDVRALVRAFGFQNREFYRVCGELVTPEPE